MEPLRPNDAKPAVPVVPAASASTPAVTPAPAPVVQPTPAVKPAGVTPTPGDKPESTVPLQALHEERSKRQALEAELALLRQNQSQPQQFQQQQQPMVNPMVQELDKLWETDPRKAVDTSIMMALDWYDRTNNSIDVQADTLAGKYSDFNNWRSAATRYVRALPPQQRAQNGVLEMAYFIVRGQNVDDILKQQNDDLMRRFQTGELAGQVGMPAGTGSAPAPRSQVALTDEQRAVANAMGLSEESYMAGMKRGA